MNKIEHASAKIEYELDYTETINEMIEDGELTTQDQVDAYLKECICDDIQVDGLYRYASCKVVKSKKVKIA